ncbi:MAG: archaellin/type IV pilin N-terminal domain-containing protein [Acidobacteriota bacterium]
MDKKEKKSKGQTTIEALILMVVITLAAIAFIRIMFQTPSPIFGGRTLAQFLTEYILTPLYDKIFNTYQ